MRLINNQPLKKRVITAFWYVPLLLATVWFGEPYFTILIAVFGIIAVFEFYRMGTTSNVMPLTYFGLIWTLLFILSRNPDLLSILKPHFDYDFLIPLLVTSAVIIPLIWLLLRRRKEVAFPSWAWTVAGILYIGWLLSHLVALRGLDDGRSWVLLALLATSGSDTVAFFAGRAWGRHRLAPSISPGKTWEGAIAGVGGAIIISLILVILLDPPISYGQAILLGLLASIFGQFGDLFESWLKRKAGVKDSGKLLPGHGGVLDRIDSIVFAGVVVYHYVIWVIL